MSAASKKLLDLIKVQREEKSKKKKFKGSLMDYVELVKKNPEIVKSSHKRLCEALESEGVTVMPDSDPRKHRVFEGENLKVYDYFQSEFFGHERVIAKIMRFLKSASHKGEESRQVLLLMGPVGAGKSALTEHIKRALEQLPYYPPGS